LNENENWSENIKVRGIDLWHNFSSEVLFLTDPALSLGSTAK